LSGVSWQQGMLRPYVKGIHDYDATLILEALLKIRSKADLLRYSSKSRACAEFWFGVYVGEEQKSEILHQLKGIAAILEVFPSTNEYENIIQQLKDLISEFTEQTKLFSTDLVDESAEYLFYELTRGDSFCDE
jgi:DNA gyrase/topoisomerase IV subunit A